MLDLIPICHFHEFLNVVFFFKCIHGIIVIDNELIRTIQNREISTRSANPNCLMFTTIKCKTATYTRKNTQVVTSLHTSCNKSVHKLSTSCVRTACF